jgi:hypothetical protein
LSSFPGEGVQRVELRSNDQKGSLRMLRSACV